MVNIPNQILDQVVKQNDIVEVISDYVTLNKKGKNYFGLCPFHHEKTPSFSVSSEKQIFHCFSCGEGGNVIQFISKIDNLPYIDSVKKLAQRVNLNINQYINQNNNQQESKYFSVNQFVSEYYQFALLNTKEGKTALDYLKDRHITKDLIKQFSIGLAPGSHNSLYLALKEHQYSELLMQELGHVTKTNGKYYDKFRNRIMFPIRDGYGNAVGFSGRTYLNNQKDEPKYINTQETKVFKKGQIIYNLYHAKKSIQKNRRVFLFEGFMDVISSVRCGILESVATMGTAITNHHIQQLKRLTNHVIICYDGDKAGIEATKKAIQAFHKEKMTVSVVTLPEGLDPDEYANQYGEDKYREYIEHEQKSYYEYMYQLYFSTINFNDISSINAFKKRVFQLIAHSTPTERELFLNKLSTDIHVSFNTLQFDFKQYTQYIHNLDTPSSHDVVIKDRLIRKAEKNRPSEKKLLETQKIIIFFCLYNRKYVNIINKDERIVFKDDKYRWLFFNLTDYYHTYDTFDYNKFVKKYIKDEDYLSFIKELFTEFKKYRGSYELKYLEQCFAVLINDYIANVVKSLKEKTKTLISDDEKKEIYQKIIDQYKHIKVKN